MAEYTRDFQTTRQSGHLERWNAMSPITGTVRSRTRLTRTSCMWDPRGLPSVLVQYELISQAPCNDGDERNCILDSVIKDPRRACCNRRGILLPIPRPNSLLRRTTHRTTHHDKNTHMNQAEGTHCGMQITEYQMHWATRHARAAADVQYIHRQRRGCAARERRPRRRAATVARGCARAPHRHCTDPEAMVSCSI